MWPGGEWKSGVQRTDMQTSKASSWMTENQNLDHESSDGASGCQDDRWCWWWRGGGGGGGGGGGRRVILVHRFLSSVLFLRGP